MKRKTSSLIALKFTLYVTTLLFGVGLLINSGFFFQRYRGELNKLQPVRTSMDIQTMNDAPNIIIKGKTSFFRPLMEEVRTARLSQEMLPELKGGIVADRLIRNEDQYILVNKNVVHQIKKNVIQENGNINFVNVTHFVQAQKKLLSVSILVLVACALLTFLIARWFVKSSLQRVYILRDFVEGLDIHSLDKTVPVMGPEDDEIQIIADKLQESLYLLQSQADSLKNFVSNASHELKTPLMSMNSLIDLAIKTGSYEQTGEKLKSQIVSMNNLFELLITLAKYEFNELHREKIDIVPRIQEIVHGLEKQYPHQELYITLPASYLVPANESAFDSIFSNLLTNAYKFTKAGDKIHISLENNILTIQDSGIGIEPKNLDSIWERFWKKDQKISGSGI